MNEIESLYEDKQEVSIDKMLCILEGQDELNFVKKVYELYNQEINCQKFIDNKIELSWGKESIVWRNIEKCKFQGGNIIGCPVPYPVLESLYNNDNLENYKAVLIMFDKDCDRNNKVENSSKEILKNLNNYIFTSNPCFEKVTIDFISTNEIRSYIDNNYQIIDYSKCRWYKNHFANLPKSNLPQHKRIFRRVNSLESLINHLKIEDIEDESVELKNCIFFIKSNF